MPFTSMKLKPESGANRIKSADDGYSFVAHMRLSYETNRLSGRPSTMSARRTRLSFWLGEPFGRRQRLKAGWWNK